MTKCPFCSMEQVDGSAFCADCGANLSNVAGAGDAVQKPQSASEATPPPPQRANPYAPPPSQGANPYAPPPNPYAPPPNPYAPPPNPYAPPPVDLSDPKTQSAMRSAKSMALVAMILGIVGFLLTFVAMEVLEIYVLVVTLGSGIAAIALATSSFKTLRKYRQSMGMGITGLIMGIIDTSVAGIALYFYLLFNML